MTSTCFSAGAEASENGPEGVGDDAGVQRETEVLDVVHVEPQFLEGFVRAGSVAVAHLCPAGDARLDPVADRVQVNGFLEFLHERFLLGPRADDRHFSPQDVVELRKFVQAKLAEDLPDPRDPLVAHAGKGGALSFAVRAHGPELGNPEGTAVLAYPRLPEQDRASGIQKDNQRHDGQQCQQERGEEHDRGDVQAALQGRVAVFEVGTVHVSGLQVLQRDPAANLLVQRRRCPDGHAGRVRVSDDFQPFRTRQVARIDQEGVDFPENDVFRAGQDPVFDSLVLRVAALH